MISCQVLLSSFIQEYFYLTKCKLGYNLCTKTCNMSPITFLISYSLILWMWRIRVYVKNSYCDMFVYACDSTGKCGLNEMPFDIMNYQILYFWFTLKSILFRISHMAMKGINVGKVSTSLILNWPWNWVKDYFNLQRVAYTAYNLRTF